MLGIFGGIFSPSASGSPLLLLSPEMLFFSPPWPSISTAMLPTIDIVTYHSIRILTKNRDVWAATLAAFGTRDFLNQTAVVAVYREEDGGIQSRRLFWSTIQGDFWGLEGGPCLVCRSNDIVLRPGTTRVKTKTGKAKAICLVCQSTSGWKVPPSYLHKTELPGVNFADYPLTAADQAYLTIDSLPKLSEEIDPTRPLSKKAARRQRKKLLGEHESADVAVKIEEDEYNEFRSLYTEGEE